MQNQHPPMECKCYQTGDYYTDQQILDITQKNLELIKERYNSPHRFLFFYSLCEDFCYWLDTQTGLCLVTCENFIVNPHDCELFYFNIDVNYLSLAKPDDIAFNNELANLQANIHSYEKCYAPLADVVYIDNDFYAIQPEYISDSTLDLELDLQDDEPF